MGQVTPLCLGCINYIVFFDDGSTREVRCRKNGSQSGTFMNVFTEAQCDEYGKPKIQGEADRYPARVWKERGVDTYASDIDGRQKTELTMKERFRDQPIFRKLRKKKKW